MDMSKQVSKNGSFGSKRLSASFGATNVINTSFPSNTNREEGGSTNDESEVSTDSKLVGKATAHLLGSLSRRTSRVHTPYQSPSPVPKDGTASHLYSKIPPPPISAALTSKSSNGESLSGSGTGISLRAVLVDFPSSRRPSLPPSSTSSSPVSPRQVDTKATQLLRVNISSFLLRFFRSWAGGTRRRDELTSSPLWSDTAASPDLSCPSSADRHAPLGAVRLKKLPNWHLLDHGREEEGDESVSQERERTVEKKDVCAHYCRARGNSNADPKIFSSDESSSHSRREGTTHLEVRHLDVAQVDPDGRRAGTSPTNHITVQDTTPRSGNRLFSNLSTPRSRFVYSPSTSVSFDELGNQSQRSISQMRTASFRKYHVFESLDGVVAMEEEHRQRVVGKEGRRRQRLEAKGTNDLDELFRRALHVRVSSGLHPSFRSSQCPTEQEDTPSDSDSLHGHREEEDEEMAHYGRYARHLDLSFDRRNSSGNSKVEPSPVAQASNHLLRQVRRLPNSQREEGTNTDSGLTTGDGREKSRRGSRSSDDLRGNVSGSFRGLALNTENDHSADFNDSGKPLNEVEGEQPRLSPLSVSGTSFWPSGEKSTANTVSKEDAPGQTFDNNSGSRDPAADSLEEMEKVLSESGISLNDNAPDPFNSTKRPKEGELLTEEECALLGDGGGGESSNRRTGSSARRQISRSSSDSIGVPRALYLLHVRRPEREARLLVEKEYEEGLAALLGQHTAFMNRK
ncbi:hypothetical protein, conserved [Angomonas deanei]|uniref:Uncharacterized protein n=1 Tax=Angomonas deanei TaxID=59799 RepID=A0A7G2CQG2_9TRYP|nr:hypothetical protein, conserved [Angomonas deanei]